MEGGVDDCNGGDERSEGVIVQYSNDAGVGGTTTFSVW